jgi:hypothetical protein
LLTYGPMGVFYFSLVLSYSTCIDQLWVGTRPTYFTFNPVRILIIVKLKSPQGLKGLYF